MSSKKKHTTPSYGLLAINHAYNQGKITFKEWLELLREWAEQMRNKRRKTKGKSA